MSANPVDSFQWTGFLKGANPDAPLAPTSALSKNNPSPMDKFKWTGFLGGNAGYVPPAPRVARLSTAQLVRSIPVAFRYKDIPVAVNVDKLRAKENGSIDRALRCIYDVIDNYHNSEYSYIEDDIVQCISRLWRSDIWPWIQFLDRIFLNLKELPGEDDSATTAAPFGSTRFSREDVHGETFGVIWGLISILLLEPSLVPVLRGGEGHDSGGLVRLTTRHFVRAAAGSLIMPPDNMTPVRILNRLLGDKTFPREVAIHEQHYKELTGDWPEGPQPVIMATLLGLAPASRKFEVERGLQNIILLGSLSRTPAAMSQIYETKAIGLVLDLISARQSMSTETDTINAYDNIQATLAVGYNFLLRTVSRFGHGAVTQAMQHGLMRAIGSSEVWMPDGQIACDVAEALAPYLIFRSVIRWCDLLPDVLEIPTHGGAVYNQLKKFWATFNARIDDKNDFDDGIYVPWGDCREPSCTARYSSKKFKRCSQCWQALYCSKKCQRKDWPAHREGCCLSAQRVKDGLHPRVSDRDRHFARYCARREIARRINGVLIKLRNASRQGGASVLAVKHGLNGFTISVRPFDERIDVHSRETVLAATRSPFRVFLVTTMLPCAGEPRWTILSHSMSMNDVLFRKAHRSR